MSMMNLTQFYSNNLLEYNENLYLYFKLGNSKYAINVKQIMEVIKLPLLEYPQKLANNVIGLLNYNNFTINVLDLRFYLDIKVTPYLVSNQLLIVKTDEAIWGLIIDEVEDIILLDQSKIEPFSSQNDKKIIDFLYTKDNETISVINLTEVENIIKQGVVSDDVDIPSLFPQDAESKSKLMQRNQALIEKTQLNLISNLFSQDQYISFGLNDGIYCVNLEFVREFVKNFSITPIPCNLDYIVGVTTLKGDFITVINLKTFLGISSVATDSDIGNEVNNPGIVGNNDNLNNIIVIESSDFKVGFLVDEIFEIIDIPEESINEKIDNQMDKYILSEVLLDNKLYSILNMPNIFSDERLFIEE